MRISVAKLPKATSIHSDNLTNVKHRQIGYRKIYVCLFKVIHQYSKLFFIF